MGMEVLDADGSEVIEPTDPVAMVPAPTTALSPGLAPPHPESNPVVVYLARLTSPASRRTMRAALDAIAEIVTSGQLDALACPWGQLRYQHTAAIRARLAERYSPASANKHLAALRGVLREAWRLGQIGAEDYHRTIDLAPVRGDRLPAGRELTAGELRALFGACAADATAAGSRDAAMIAILYAGGLRRSEAVGLDVADYDAATGALRVLRGKGNKARAVYLNNGARDAVDAWLPVRGAEPGALLVPINKAGRITIRRLSAQAVYDVLRRRGDEAGVSAFSPHDCRRSFVSHLLEAGADISAVQKLAGHASVTTTARYDRRGERAKRKAAELLHVPFVRKA